MTWLEWSSLDEDARSQACQQLNPYDSWELFKEVEKAFLLEFARQEGVSEVFCGVGGGLGGANAVTVTIARGKKKTKLLDSFMGFPVIRRYAKA
jgi:hypothetical protein